MPAIFQAIYVSTADKDLSVQDVQAILAKSRENNSRAGLTGMLLYHDGSFMQALEGEEGAVRLTLARIEGDTRHHGIIKLVERVSDTRDFGGWRMAYVNSQDLADQTDAYSDFLTCTGESADSGAVGSQAHKLLLSFKRSQR